MLSPPAVKSAPPSTGPVRGAAGAPLLANAERTGNRTIAGFVVDPAELGRRHVVELLLDGRPGQVMRADRPDDELATRGIGDTCYGFRFELDGDSIAHCSVAEVRLANSGESIALPIRLGEQPARAKPPVSRVRWMGGLRLAGWVGLSDQTGGIVEAWLDGRLVASAVCDHWVDVDRDRPVPGFDFWLPVALADGRLKTIHVYHDGEELRGSPVPVIAFEDGLKRFLLDHDDGAAEIARGKVFDRILPQSISFEDFADWLERYPLVINSAATGPASAVEIAVAIIGETDLGATLASLERESGWTAAVFPLAGARTQFSAPEATAFLAGEAAHCSIVLPVLSGTVLQPGALDHMRRAIAADPAAAIAYADILVQCDGRVWPIAHTAFDYERCLEQGFGALFFAMRRAAAVSAVETGANDLYRLFNAPLDGPAQFRPLHIHAPGFAAAVPAINPAEAGKALARATAAHLQTRNRDAEMRLQPAQTFPAVRVRRRARPAQVSIIIPTRDRAELLAACVHSLAETRRMCETELVVVDNDSTEPACLELLARLRRDGARIVRVPGPFNFARLMNVAAASAQGEFLCLLNNDIEALDGDWLIEMASRLTEPDTGAVGAKLVWPSGIVQHGGVVLGPGHGVQHAFTNRTDFEPGYGGLLAVAHECSAVTAACLLTRRADYLAVGGMDELHFPVHFNDVDYCLKLRALGRRIVFTPYARLLHRASSSLSRVWSREMTRRHERELTVLRARWGHVLADDPYYSPLLSLDPLPFTGLAWPPRGSNPRFASGAAPARVPIGF